MRLRRYEMIALLKEDKSHKQHRNNKTSRLLSAGPMILQDLSSSSERDFHLAASKLKALKARLAKLKLPVLQTVGNHYALANYYWHTASQVACHDMTTQCLVVFQS